jgi:S-formylglutathione hydrolase
VATLIVMSVSAHDVRGQQPAPLKGALERIVVHGRALEGNLEGDLPDPPVVVYLSPSYTRETSRRYPVLYYLHG